MGTERARLNIDAKTSGIQGAANLGNVLTGINSSLNLMKEGFALVQKAGDAALSTLDSLATSGSRYEQWGDQFEGFKGSVVEAEKSIEDLQTRLGKAYEIEEILDAAAALETIGVNANVSMGSIADMAGFLGQELGTVASAWQSVFQGRWMQIEKLGITMEDIIDKLGGDKSMLTNVQAVAAAMDEISMERFAGGMEGYAETFESQVKQMKNAWFLFKQEIADAGPFHVIKTVFDTVLSSIEKLTEGGQAENLAEIVGRELSIIMLETMKLLLESAGDIERASKAIVSWTIEAAPKAMSLWDRTKAFVGTGGMGYDASRMALTREQQIAMGLPVDPLGPTGVSSPAAESVRVDALAAITELLEGYKASRTDPSASPARQSQPGAGAGPTSPRLEGYVSGFETTSAWGASDPSGMQGIEDARLKALEKHEEAVGRTVAVMGGYWHSYYSSISAVSTRSALEQGKLLQGVWGATRKMIAGTLSDYIRAATEKASLGSKIALAEMFAAEGTFNFWAAAKHASAIGAWAAVGGMASGMVESFIGGGEEISIDTGGGGGGYEDDSGGGTRNLSRNVGLKAQSLTINTYLVFQSAAIFGRDGMTELVEDELEPALVRAGELGRF